MRQFELLAAGGSQIFVSTHSAHFLDVARSDRIVLVDRCQDDEHEICTQVKTASSEDLLRNRRSLHPTRVQMTVDSVRAFVRNVRNAEMTEAFFARVIMIVEGPSEREAFPLFARALGLDFDEHGISIVSAGGKGAIDALAHLYMVHGIKAYIVFDNDWGNQSEKAANRTLCRLLGIPETDAPEAGVKEGYAILHHNWEAQCRSNVETIQVGLYDEIDALARAELGISGDRNKPLVARFIANELVRRGIVPNFVSDILHEIKAKLPEHISNGTPQPSA